MAGTLCRNPGKERQQAYKKDGFIASRASWISRPGEAMLDRPSHVQHPAVFVQVVVAELRKSPAQESFRFPSYVKRPAAGMTGSMNEGQHHRLARGKFRRNPN
jgi:hypothetical protein